MKCIVVGKCSNSDGLLFYHPPSKQLLSCADGYKFDTFMPAGPQLGENFDGNFVFNLQSDVDTIHRAPTHEEKSTVYLKSTSNPTIYIEATVLNIPLNEDTDPYIVQETISGDIRECMAKDTMDHNPTADPTEHTTVPDIPTMPWIIHKC